MEEETDKTTVEEIETNSSESSSDKQDLDNLSPEELKAELLRKDAALRKANEHMREQAKKHSVANKQGQEEQEDNSDILATIREEAKKAVREEQENARISTYANGSNSWLKQQEWAKDMFKGDEQSDALYAKFSSELGRIVQNNSVKTQEDYQRLMRLAAVNTTLKPDALLDSNVNKEIQNDKTMSSYRGSAPAVQDQSYEQFSLADQQMIRSANILRAKIGKGPIKVKGNKIIKD